MRTFIALLIISSFTYLAYSQVQCSTPAPAGCAWCTGSTPAGSIASGNVCTQCSSGYLLTNSNGGCSVACSTGCAICNSTTYCFACSSGYALWSATAVCVANPSGCSVGNALSATTSNCTTCWGNWTANNGTCVQCGGTATVTVNTWQSVPNCATCTATAATTANSGQTVTGNWVTCLTCVNGYFLVPRLTGTTAGTNLIISTPECIPANTAAPTTGTWTITGAGNNWPTTSAVAVTATGSNTGCSQGTLAALTAGTTTAITAISCTVPASGYWCLSYTSSPTLATQSCINAAVTGVWTPLPSVTNCLAGLCTAALSGAFACTSIQCTMCATGYYLSAAAAANNCTANVANCVTQVSATNCTQAAQGYTLVNSLPVACTNATTSCTGGPLSTQLWIPSGGVITGTAVTGCAVYNASSVCVLCAGFVTNVQNCTACPSNCANCTVNSAGVSSCTTCVSGYQAWNGNSSCLAACANGTNRTVNGTCYSKNMIASVVAFVSFVFYYIF